jgi:hypothetical protein
MLLAAEQLARSAASVFITICPLSSVRFCVIASRCRLQDARATADAGPVGQLPNVLLDHAASGDRAPLTARVGRAGPRRTWSMVGWPGGHRATQR